MKVDSIQNVGFSVIVQANEGEDQFTINLSTGQNGQTTLTMLQNQVDLGPEPVVFSGRVPTLHVWLNIESAFRKWHILVHGMQCHQRDLDEDVNKLKEIFERCEIECVF